MKSNLKFLAIAAIASTTFLASCGGDDETPPTKEMPNTASNKTIGGQTAGAGSFYSSAKGEVYLTSDSNNFAANLVDMSYAQIGPTAATLKPMLISLSERKTQGLNRVVGVTRATTFAASTLSKAQFDTVSNNYVKALPSAGAGAIEIQAGKVYSYNNAENKRGLVYITTISGTGTASSITIDSKLQK